MAEEHELIVGTKYGGIKEVRNIKEKPVSGERSIGRSFKDIQHDLRDYIRNRNPKKEEDLKKERSPIIADATSESVDILSSLKFHLREAQTGNRFDIALDQINDIDAEALERHARDTNAGWRDDFEGLIPEYKRLAIVNMQKALEEARHGRDSQEWQDLNNEIQVMGWGIPPTDLVERARKFLDDDEQNQAVVHDAAAEELRKQRKEKLGHRERIQRAVAEIKENGNSPEAWARLVFQEVLAAEADSKRNLKRSDENGQIWKALADALDEMPGRLGGAIDRTSDLSVHLRNEHPGGLDLKERLNLYVDARRHFMNRWVEVTRAAGSFTGLGLGSKDVPFEGITYGLENITPQDWHVMYHMDEMFGDISNRLSPEELKEFLPNVSKGSETWLEAGMRYKTLPDNMLKDEEKAVVDFIFQPRIQQLFNKHYKDKDKVERLRPRIIDRKNFWPSPKDIYTVLEGKLRRDRLATLIDIFTNIPTYHDSINNADLRNDLIYRMKNLADVDTQAIELADRVFAISLTHQMLDRNRAGQQGSDEPRDVMWLDRKRVYNYANKQRNVALPWTVGRYYVQSPDQYLDSDDGDDIGKERRRMLLHNTQRGLFSERLDYFQGQLVGDFFQHFVAVPDELNPGGVIFRKMSSFLINNDGTIKQDGFRNIPFLRMGPLEYSGYFNYSMTIAKLQAEAISSTQWKDPKEMENPDYWTGKQTLLERTAHISPRFNTKEFDLRGVAVRELLNDGGFVQSEIDRINGLSSLKDLDVISNPQQKQRAIAIIRQNRDTIRNATKVAEKYYNNQFMKFKLIHALGEVYPGTLYPLKEAGRFNDESIINNSQMERIVKALRVSGYLNEAALKRFVYEVFQEMGIGKKWIFGKDKRYEAPMYSF